jgi:hypothetical protein
MSQPTPGPRSPHSSGPVPDASRGAAGAGDEEPGRDGRPSTAREQSGPGWPGVAYEEPDPEWPDEDAVPAPSWPAPPWPAPPGRATPGGDGSRRRAHALTVAAVAVIAATLGVVVALLIANRSAGTPSATSSPPSATTPALGTGGGAITGGGSSGGGGGGEMLLGGQVVAVSSTSITVTGQGQQITAAITSSTKFTGVSGASQIKVGAEVTAQISGYGTSHAVATAIQDPAQFP